MNRLICIQPSGHVSVLLESEIDEANMEGGCPALNFIKGFMQHLCYLEHLRIKYEGKPAHLFCDEDGLGRALHFNQTATMVVQGYGNPSHNFVGPVAIWTGEME